MIKIEKATGGDGQVSINTSLFQTMTRLPMQGFTSSQHNKEHIHIVSASA